LNRSPPRLVIVDDHQIVLDGLRAMLSGYASSVQIIEGEACEPEDAIALVTDVQPDIVLLDVRLRTNSGLDLCAAILRRRPECKIVFLTVYDDEQYLYQAIRLGAAGFLLKRVRGLELVEYLARIHQGETLVDPALAARVAQSAARLQNGEFWPGAYLGLTQRDSMSPIAPGPSPRPCARGLSADRAQACRPGPGGAAARPDRRDDLGPARPGRDSAGNRRAGDRDHTDRRVLRPPARRGGPAPGAAWRELKIHAEVHPCELPAHVAAAVYRIAQEALQNVVKHAEARSARVRLLAHGDKMTLEVEDNGKGFKPSASAGQEVQPGPYAYGLRSMHERAELLGGMLEVRSRPGQGTLLRLRFPAAGPEPGAPRWPAALTPVVRKRRGWPGSRRAPGA
jgi:DNA-binding NarL/FixJ family response regulator/anti-sigma regulatory factor (Ser/Thr protein kinase)